MSESLVRDSPWFAPIYPVLQQMAWPALPVAGDWSSLVYPHWPVTKSGQPIRFVAPALLDDVNYEQCIATSGCVATRPGNWHDTFNALCWLAWPQAKAALNALHVRELAVQSGKQRSPARDAATLFDESGVVVPCASPLLVGALRAQDWDALFCRHRLAWGTSIKAFIFGHALMEKGLSPYIGVVGKVILVDVTESWFSETSSAQLRWLDQHLAAIFDGNQIHSPRDMPPLPVLGIPGWWPSQDAAFYADTRHFRPSRADAVRPG
jgi:hypothetical protein